MRKHLSLSTLLATLALFVSLSGTAVAAILVSSNHQVAAHTIAGANAPRGDNRNLIAGSVGTSDLHDGAITAGKVKDGSLVGADLANGTVGTAKLKLPKIAFSGAGVDADDLKPHHTVLTLDGVTLGVSCIFSGAPPQTTRLVLFVKSTTSGTLQGVYGTGTPQLNQSAAEQATRVAVGSSAIGFAALGSTSAVTPTILAGQFSYFDKHRVIVLTVTGSATEGKTCDLQGTAVPAPN